MTPEKQLAWTLTLAGREFGVHRDTLRKKLVHIGEHADAAGHYTTSQITNAIWGDIDRERLRKTKEEADKLEMENRRTRDETIDIEDAVEAVGRFGAAIRQKILLASMPDEEKAAIIADIHGMKNYNFAQIQAIEMD